MESLRVVCRGGVRISDRFGSPTAGIFVVMVAEQNNNMNIYFASNNKLIWGPQLPLYSYVFLGHRAPHFKETDTPWSSVQL